MRAILTMHEDWGFKQTHQTVWLGARGRNFPYYSTSQGFNLIFSNLLEARNIDPV